MPGWLTQMLRDTELDLSRGAKYSLETTEALLANFDRNVSEARAVLSAAKDPDFDVAWSLKMGDRVLMTQPRRDVEDVLRGRRTATPGRRGGRGW